MKRTPLKRSGFKPPTYAEILESRATQKPRRGLKASSLKRGKRMRGIRIDQADKFFSLYIRYRDNWQCTRCGTQYEVGSQGLHNSHFWGRARESTRFDPANCVAHCHGCHAYLTANPADHYQWKLKRMGQRDFDLLAIRAETRQKKDRQLAAIIAKQLYEEEKTRFENKID